MGQGSTKIRGAKRRDRLPSEGRASVRGRRLDVQPSMSATLTPRILVLPHHRHRFSTGHVGGARSASGFVTGPLMVSTLCALSAGSPLCGHRQRRIEGEGLAPCSFPPLSVRRLRRPCQQRELPPRRGDLVPEEGFHGVRVQHELPATALVFVQHVGREVPPVEFRVSVGVGPHPHPNFLLLRAPSHIVASSEGLYPELR